MCIYFRVFSIFIICFYAPVILFSQDQPNTTRDFRIRHYDLTIAPDIANQYIRGSNKIQIEPESELSVIELDLSSSLRIDSIFLNDIPVSFRHFSDRIFIFPQSEITTNKRSVIHIFYQGHPLASTNPPWDGGLIWSFDSLSRPWVGVACEGIGASSWWPCKDQWDSEADSIRLSILTDSSLTAVANGVLTRVQPLDNKKLYTWEVNYPINNYCVSFTLGAFRHFSDTLKRSDNSILSADYYILDYNYHKANEHFRQVPKIIQTFEELFGPYPFEKDGYKLVEAPYWGMEHQSAIAYGNNFINNFFELDYIIVHETAHEWWGNKLTANEQKNMWIHEAFATYSEILLLEKLYGDKLAGQYLLKQKEKIINRYPITASASESALKDTDQYYKGSWMLHTIRYMINDDSVWFNSLKQLQQQFAYKTVGRDEFINTWGRLLGRDINPVISYYLDRKEPPVLSWRVRKTKRRQYLYLKWDTPLPDFSLPVKLSYDNVKLRINTISGARYTKIVLPAQAKDITFNLNDFLFTTRHFQQ